MPKIALDDGTDWAVPREFMDKLYSVYKRDAVDGEFAKIDLWLTANPARRKTRRGALKFLAGWMVRAELPRALKVQAVPTCCECHRRAVGRFGGASYCGTHAPAPQMVLA